MVQSELKNSENLKKKSWEQKSWEKKSWEKKILRKKSWEKITQKNRQKICHRIRQIICQRVHQRLRQTNCQKICQHQVTPKKKRSSPISILRSSACLACEWQAIFLHKPKIKQTIRKNVEQLFECYHLYLTALSPK